MSKKHRTPAEAIKAAMAELKLTVSEFAKALEVSPQLVSFMSRGERSVPADKVPQIVSLTKGDVKHWELRPTDWRGIWPELIPEYERLMRAANDGQKAAA